MDYDKYPGDFTMWWSDLLNGEEGHGWKPSIHMPRWASRIILEITDIRVERVQDIHPPDLLAEGVYPFYEKEGSREIEYTAKEYFAKLWDSINAKRGYGWDVNPWAWVIEFKKVD
jgi:hypothetical protein